MALVEGTCVSSFCSTVHRRIKGAARSINAILQPTVLYFPAVEGYSIVVSMRLSAGSQIGYTTTV